MFFDSCAHPTINGEWAEGRRGITFKELAASREKNPGYMALAIGLPGVGAYEHAAFKRECERWGFLAIAAITTVAEVDLMREFETIVRLGFRGVKVHPRLLRRNTDHSYLKTIFTLCRRHGLVCLLCTYEWDTPGNLPNSDPFYQLCEALNLAPDIKHCRPRAKHFLPRNGHRRLPLRQLNRHCWHRCGPIATNESGERCPIRESCPTL